MADKTFIKSGNVTNAADETINIADLLTDIKTVLESLDVTVNASDINIGNVDVVTLPELPAGTNLVGKMSIDQVTANANEVVVKSITAGDNNIGNVDVVTLPELPAGTKLIGKVGIDQSTANANEVVTKSGSVTTATLATETTKVIGTVNNKIANGDDVALGAKADAPATTGTTDAWSVIALLKGLFNKLGAVVLTTGSAIIGRVGIDQVTANANEVVVKSITAGDTNIGNVDIVSLPSDNLGAKAKAASLCVNPASDIADGVYIGDIKFGEELPAGTQLIGKVGSNVATVSTSQTRPANNAPYTALDVVGTDAATVMTFASVVSTAGKSAIITGVSLRADTNAVPAGMSGFRLHLYDAAPTPIVDNAAFNLISADRDKYIGYIDIDTPIDMGDTLYIENLNINKQIKTVTTSIYGQLQTIGAFTPASACVKTVELQTLEV